MYGRDITKQLDAAGQREPRLELNSLRLLSIIAPAVFVAGIIVLIIAFVDDVPLALLVSLAVLAVTAAATLFSAVVFHVIERSEAGLLERNQQLAAVQAAATSIAAEFDLHMLLQRFVDSSREITGARYGAMSVIDTDDRILEFITSGLAPDERARIGAPPVGRGLLGVIINEGRALRLRDISRDSRSAGFPPHHPPMKSLLGVPVVSRGKTIGNLYLTDKIDAPEFTPRDEEMVRTFAAHAAVAIETSRLQDELRLLAVLRERERIGMDLHDGIIQSIYAVSLGLEVAAEELRAGPPGAIHAVDAAIDQLSAVIRDVRSYIFELRPSRLSYDFSDSLTHMVHEFEQSSLAHVQAEIVPALPSLGEEQRTAIFHIAREALVNARRHAGSGSIRIALHSELDGVHLEVSDTGTGFDPSVEVAGSHRGLRNMAARAEAAGGTLTVDSAPGKGTCIRVHVPVHAEEGAQV